MMTVGLTRQMFLDNLIHPAESSANWGKKALISNIQHKGFTRSGGGGKNLLTGNCLLLSTVTAGAGGGVNRLYDVEGKNRKKRLTM